MHTNIIRRNTSGMFTEADVVKCRNAAFSNPKARVDLVSTNGRPALILAGKFGPQWWERATPDDLHRVAIF